MNPYLAFFAAACIPAAAFLAYSWEDDRDKDARITQELYRARASTKQMTPAMAAEMQAAGLNYTPKPGQNSLKDQQLLAFIFARRHDSDVTKVFLEQENIPVSEDPAAQAYLKEQIAVQKAQQD